MFINEVSKETLGKYTPTAHPIMVAPTAEQIANIVKNKGIDRACELLQLREDKILAETMDPYRHGYEPEHWKTADGLLSDPSISELMIFGGNRASKTEYAAKRVAQYLSQNPSKRVWCIHTTNMSSVQMQQPVVYKYLPAEYKTARKTKITNVAFTQKNGFSDNTFVLPNKSQCWFLNQSQDIKVIEGGEVDLIWIDEEITADWIKTLRYRTATRRGKMILTFTPISGYTSVVKEYIAGAMITKWLPASLLKDSINVPGGERGTMPFQATCHNPSNRAIWFHSELNLYSPFSEIKRALHGRTNYEVKIRAYGWAESLSGSQFPKFGNWNVIPDDQIPEKGTNYMAMDPAGARNWFMLWLRVDEHGRKFIYREWPSIDLGEWAIPSDKPDGKAGAAQRNGAGRGINDYKALIDELEGKEEIADRFIDPRAGGTQAIGKDGGTSLTDLLAEDPNPMWFTPAAGLRIEEGISIINDWLAWDKDEPLLAIHNEPNLYVSENCKNIIYSLREWTGADGDKGATKDPVDVLRYLAVMNPTHQNSQSFQPQGEIGSY